MTDDFQITQTSDELQADLDLTENLQPTFSTSATYAVNDIVIYNSKLYKCHTAVTSAGAWDGTKWSEIHIDSLVSSLTDADIDLALSAEIITMTVTNGTATGDSVIAGTATVTIVPNEGYVLPSSVTVVGATSSYDDSTGVISLSSATGEVTITCVCEASGGGLPEPKQSLSAYTWEEIKQLADALADNTISSSDLSTIYHIAIGDTKSSTINNENHSYRLIGIKHDVDANGITLGMTFGQVDLMATTYVMKSPMSNTDSWQNSNLKTTLEGFTVASDLAAVITPAKKVCANNVSSGTPTYEYINTVNGLWIESETELSGTQNVTIGHTVEGSKYAYYTNDGKRVKQRNGSDDLWWARSPSQWDNNYGWSYFARVYSNGNVGNEVSSNGRSIAPCFCI